MQTFQLADGGAYRRCIAFAPDGRALVVGCPGLALIDTTTGTIDTDFGFDSAFWNVAFTRGGTALASIQMGDLQVIDLVPRQPHVAPFDTGTALSVAADADRLFVSVLDYDRMSGLRAVSATDLAEQVEFAESNDVPRWLTVSADGRWLAGNLGNALCVWDVGRTPLPNKPALTKKTLGTNGHALSGNGARLVAVHNQGVCVWDVRTGKERFRSGKHRQGVTAVACHPSRELIATGDSGGKVFVWDHTGRVLTKFDWGLEHVAGLAFSPDGLRCAAVDDPGKVVVWDVDA